MKYCVQEFSSFTPKQIMEECIVGEPAVRKIAVHRDEPDAPGAPSFPAADLAEDMLDGNERIQGIDTVDKTQREGTTIYDIIFQAKVPVTGAMIGLIINVEIQNDEKLLYYVVTRGLYYCARMLSAQKNRIFMHSDYQKIQKVYSIWICPYAKNGKNTIASYDMKEHVHFGDVDVPKEAYDKLETVVITMNADGIKSESELIRYLSLLLNREMPQEERVEALKNEYHIQVDDALREDVSKMCNYSDAILRMGENKGLEQGRIMEAVSIYRDEMEMDDNSIIKKIMKRFTLNTTKTTGFGPTSGTLKDDPTVDRYTTYDVSVKKNVQGSLADRSHEFPFFVTIANSIAGAKITYSNDGSETITGATKAEQKYTLTAADFTIGEDAKTSSLKLKHNDTITIIGVPSNQTTDLTITVNEYNDSHDVYTPSVEATSGIAHMASTNAKTGNSMTALSGSDSTTAFSIPSNDIARQTIQINNLLSEVSPTGYFVRFAPYALILVGGIVLMLIAVKRKKHHDEED